MVLTGVDVLNLQYIQLYLCTGVGVRYVPHNEKYRIFVIRILLVTNVLKFRGYTAPRTNLIPELQQRYQPIEID